MKRLQILFVIIFSFFTFKASAALTLSFYADNSVLSEGNWVKVGVDRTGVYEISYDQLQAMGFSDPSRVSVYGRGGRVLPEDFVTNSGMPTLHDDLAPVRVIHENRKLYFFGVGPEEISYIEDENYPGGGYFDRRSLNIYSKRGYYFLTDSYSPQNMPVQAFDSSVTDEVNSGYSYIYHEKDSVQNSTQTGQLFWGERIGLPSAKKRTWQVSMPDAISGEGTMKCAIYFSNHDDVDAYVNFGFSGTNTYFSTPYRPTGSSFFIPHTPSVGKIGIPGKKGTVFTEFTLNRELDQSFLDYWVVTYRRAIPTMKDADDKALGQQYLALADIRFNMTKKFRLQNCDSYIVLDVTDCYHPKRLEIDRRTAGEGWVTVHNEGDFPLVVVFDTQMPQMKISGFESAFNVVENQNLHNLKQKGADFIIISTPEFREYAEQIATLHRVHDNIEVVVATTEECYNEFSAGVPDPMAYRSFAKMLYMTKKAPKNMLLLGPLYGDFRGVIVERNPLDGIIAFQSPEISISRGAHNINDFYGMMNDKFDTEYYERNPVHIGVAVLPIKFSHEGDIIVEKIKNYLDRTDFAYYLNKYTAVGGLGDDHTHDSQIEKISVHVKNLDYRSMIITPLSIDTYGNREAKKKFLNQLNDGCNILTYFGHGAEQFLGKDRNFFAAGDVYKLSNRILPFVGFGGCQITNTDRGMRGLGETIVTAVPAGCIGALASARETWSGQNLEFFKLFFTCLFKNGPYTSSDHSFKPKTIGEVYASVKNHSTYTNELAYQLLMDPALVVPVANQWIVLNNSLSLQLTPGEINKINGYVVGQDGRTKDSSFNGELVVRLMEPARKVKCGQIETKENPGSLEFTYADNQVAMTAVKVKNGEFEIDLAVPSSLRAFASQAAILHLCAYSSKTKAGAGTSVEIPVLKTSGSTAESRDLIPPVIEQFSFIPSTAALKIRISDNYALNYSSDPFSKGLSLYVDGIERMEGHFTEPQIETDRPAYSKTVYLNSLPYGEHTARIRAKDTAGNSVEQEIKFVYSPDQPEYAIYVSEDSNPGESVILASGAAPADAVLYIRDIAGNEIWSGKFSAQGTVWDWKDRSGNKVAPGHYKGYILEKGSSTSKGYSSTVDIPVI